MDSFLKPTFVNNISESEEIKSTPVKMNANSINTDDMNLNVMSQINNLQKFKQNYYSERSYNHNWDNPLFINRNR